MRPERVLRLRERGLNILEIATETGFSAMTVQRLVAMQELSLRGLRTATQTPFPIAYKGKNVGTYSADLVVEDRLLVEEKCVEQFSNEHLAQCIDYLKASGLHLALLINFRRREWNGDESSTNSDSREFAVS